MFVITNSRSQKRNASGYAINAQRGMKSQALHTLQGLDTLHVPQLKTLCSQYIYGLATSGRRATLLLRLKTHLNSRNSSYSSIGEEETTLVEPRAPNMFNTDQA